MPDRITQAAPEPSTLPLPCNIAPARLAPQVITTDVIAEKYCKDNDTCATDIQRRIAHALATSRPPHDEERFFTA